jgi:hypothetical protein
MDDLIDILKHIEKRPGTYFGERWHSIHILRAFILGFGTASASPPSSQGNLDCFTEWVAAHYNVLADGMGSFDLILDHVDRDEQKAFDEFFKLLPEYLRDRDEIGRDGILSRFSKVQDECMEALRKQP